MATVSYSHWQTSGLNFRIEVAFEHFAKANIPSFVARGI